MAFAYTSCSMIPFLHLGPLTLPTFGLMIATAMVCSFFVIRADLRRRGMMGDGTGLDAETLVALPTLAGLIGAKLYHVLESPRELFSDPVGQLFSSFGFAWFGGLIAGLVAFVWLARRHRIPILTLFDAASPAAALGYGIGRIGCLLSGDGDYGVPTSLPWAMSFPNGLVPTTQHVHPTPIYEFLIALVIAWVLWRLGASVSAQPLPNLRTPGLAARGSTRSGIVFSAYLILTGIARFLIEFIRINPRSFLGLTNAQTASLASFFLGIGLLWHLRQREVAGEAS